MVRPALLIADYVDVPSGREKSRPCPGRLRGCAMRVLLARRSEGERGLGAGDGALPGLVAARRDQVGPVRLVREAAGSFARRGALEVPARVEHGVDQAPGFPALP